MSEMIRRIVVAIRGPRGFLSIRAGVRRYTPPSFHYPSTEEAWTLDWQNIGNDFRKAAKRLEAQIA